MSQNGLHYATDHYDLQRYRRMQQMSAQLLAIIDAPAGGDEPVGSSDAVAKFHRALQAEAGHATPKVDVRAALFDGDRVLLVQEARDRRWTLPGGWADALDSPAAAAAREFAEEAGLRVRISHLAAVHDGTRRNAHAVGATGSPWHVYKLIFVADLEPGVDQQPTAGLDGETSAASWFGLHELPPLSTGRTSVEQLRLLHAHHLDRGLPTEFD